MKGIRGTRLAALAAAGLLAGCAASTGTPTGSVTAAPTAPVEISLSSFGAPDATPTPAASPTPNLIYKSQDTIEALGGDAPIYTFSGTGTVNPLGLPWPSVTMGEWTVAFDSKGELAYVFHVYMGEGQPTSVGLPKEQARANAQAVLGALGVNAGPPDAVTFEIDTWSVTWARKADGIPVDTDGILVTLNPDGSFRGYARLWRDLSPRSEKMLTVGEAISKVDACKAPKGKASPCKGAGLNWYQASDDQAAPLRLGWHISVSDGWYMVDAETGAVTALTAMYL